MTKEEAIDVYNGLINPKIKEAFEFFVPELRESDDDRIKRNCIHFLELQKGHHASTIEIDECIAWLEKKKESEEELSIRLNGLMQEYVKAGENDEEQEHRLKCYQLFWDALSDSEFFKKEEQKPILEVYDFRVGDAVRLKDGDGRTHIIKAFEEIEGIHGPNFYHVIFEDNTASDHIIPGEEYPNGYFTCMEKIEQESKYIPKFKIGDKIKLKSEPKYPYREIVDIKNGAYYFDKEIHLSFKYQDRWEKERKPAEYLSKRKVYDIMNKLTELSTSDLIPLESEEYVKIHEITSDVCSLLDYPIEQKEQKPQIFIPKFRVGDKVISTKNEHLTYDVLEVGHINELGNPEYRVKIYADGKSDNDIKFIECRKMDEWGKLIEQMPEWSLEDERILDNLIRFYSREDSASAWRWSDGTITYGDVVKFLKSLRSQRKVELTELDKNILEAAIAFVEQNDHFNCWRGVDKHTVLSALRSLKLHWKPTNEQMDALKHSGFGCYVYGDGPALRSLYNDLKKLM